MYYKGGPVLLVLAAPDQLRVEVAITPLIRYANWRLLALLQYRLVLGSRNVLASGFLMRKRFDG